MNSAALFCSFSTYTIIVELFNLLSLVVPIKRINALRQRLKEVWQVNCSCFSLSRHRGASCWRLFLRASFARTKDTASSRRSRYMRADVRGYIGFFLDMYLYKFGSIFPLVVNSFLLGDENVMVCLWCVCRMTYARGNNACATGAHVHWQDYKLSPPVHTKSGAQHGGC
jgi:hypothetical protein